MSTDQLAQQIQQFNERLGRVRRLFLSDGRISPAEQRRLDAMTNRIEELRSRLRSAADRAGGVDIDRAVQQARTLQARFEGARNDRERAQLAGSLIAIHGRLESLLRGGPMDENGLPALTGSIQWNRGSPAAGTLEDIQPFGAIDLWRAAVAGAPEPAPARDRPVRREPGERSDEGVEPNRRRVGHRRRADGGRAGGTQGRRACR